MCRQALLIFYHIISHTTIAINWLIIVGPIPQWRHSSQDGQVKGRSCNPVTPPGCTLKFLQWKHTYYALEWPHGGKTRLSSPAHWLLFYQLDLAKNPNGCCSVRCSIWQRHKPGLHFYRILWKYIYIFPNKIFQSRTADPQWRLWEDVRLTLEGSLDWIYVIRYCVTLIEYFHYTYSFEFFLK